MPLDTRIALSGQPLQLESPLTQYSQLMNIQHAGTQNQLAQMQISAAQRAADEEAGFKNYLSTADLTTPEGQRGAMAYGKTGMSALKTIAEQKKASLESDEITAKVLGLAQKNFAARYSPLEAAAGQEQGVAGYVDAMYKDPILGPLAAKVKPKEQALADNLAMFKKDPNQWITAHANLEGQHLLDALKMSAAREAEARAFTPPAGTPTVPMNAPAAPVAPVAPAAPPVISQDRLTVSQDASGTSTYYIDGKPVDPQTFAAARASSAPATMLPNTRAADLASMSPAAATAPAPAVAPAAATAPAVAPVVAPAAQPNLLNNLTLRIKGIEEQRNRLLPDIGKSAAVKAQWEDLGKQIENLSKGFSVSPGAAHFVPGVGMVERPAAEPTSADVTTMKALGYPITQDGFKAFTEAKRQEKSKSEFEQLLEDSGMTDAQKKAARAERIKKESTFAPPMQISLTQNAEKSYGTAFGGKIADQDAAKLDAATKAPELAVNANRVLASLNDGNVFVGPAATIKLNLARVLNAAGASNDEKIANTETLISNLGRNTLGMVKSSGLGTGQGFTDKDLQFLEKVAGGSIDYNAQTLRNLAELSHKAAEASAKSWNKRAKEIPASAIAGTGISTEAITVPARAAKAAAATRPAGVPADWALHTDAAGKKAYVSPDGKSFKEVP